METTEEGDSRIVIRASEKAIRSTLFMKDGKEVLSAGDQGMLRRWQTEDGHNTGEPFQIRGSEIYSIALSPDCRWLVCGLRPLHLGFRPLRATARVWNVRTQKIVLNIKGHDNTVFSVNVSPDSTKFATGGFDQVAYVWSITTGKRLLRPLKHNGPVMAVQFSPDGSRLATATAENPGAKSIRIFDSVTGLQLLEIPFRIGMFTTPSLAWSADCRRLFAASYSGVKCFDAFSGSQLSGWSVPGGGRCACIALSPNQKFVAVVALKSLSFWDAITHKQIGNSAQHASNVWSIAFSPNDECIVTGEDNGNITIRHLRDVLPCSYLPVEVSNWHDTASESNFVLCNSICSPHFMQLPLMCINDALFTSWRQNNLTRAEDFLTKEITRLLDINPTYHAHALAHRAILRSRSKQWGIATEDAKKSLKVKTVIGHVANAVVHIGSADHESAMRAFDLAFTDHSLPTENNFLLLIKIVILFSCGKHDDAVSRINDLIDIIDDKSLYAAVRAHMLFLLGDMSLKQGDSGRATKFLQDAQKAIPFQENPHLVVISLIFGWDFKGLGLAVQERLRECIKPLEGHGDAVLQPGNSTALSLHPPNSASLLRKKSKTLAMSKQWDSALRNADEAIKVDPGSPLGYEKRHAALHGLRRYDEAIETFAHMLSIMDRSPDQDIRQLGKRYLSPASSVMFIDDIIHRIFKTSPLVLINIKSGHLYDGPERKQKFKSELQFKELVSSMLTGFDEDHIRGEVEEYFRYVTLSHVWSGEEPSFQDVSLAGSVWKLDSSPLNLKLKNFCKVVSGDGYLWAWSDTCCIDKTISTVLNQSLTMMYKWYEASAATFVHLMDVDSLSRPGGLTDSVWMTRAWTAQELLAAKAIRFYDCNWKPYLGDTRPNHKQSPNIMQELADAICIPRETIVAFDPKDLSVREKLRIASTRHARVDEDVAYSLIGIFKSDIRPNYGEGNDALGHLLEETVARSGEVTVLDWTGESSLYNSCLPATLAVYSQPSRTLPAVEDTEMEARITELKATVPEAQTMPWYHKVNSLPSARFANRRLHLPSIIFGVKRLSVRDSGSGHWFHYEALVSGIGDVEFQTSDRLPLTEPRRLVFVHPWIRDLRDPFDRLPWGSIAGDDESILLSEVGSMTSAPLTVPTTPLDPYTRALRFIVRLQQPFYALLLQQQSNGEFKRVAAEHAIVMPGVDHSINHGRDVRTGVVEIL